MRLHVEGRASQPKCARDSADPSSTNKAIKNELRHTRSQLSHQCHPCPTVVTGGTHQTRWSAMFDPRRREPLEQRRLVKVLDIEAFNEFNQSNRRPAPVDQRAAAAARIRQAPGLHSFCFCQWLFQACRGRHASPHWSLKTK